MAAESANLPAGGSRGLHIVTYKMHPSRKIDIIEYRDGSFSETADSVASEKRLRIISDGTELLSILCTPTMIKELVVGFALSEGLVGDRAPDRAGQEWCSERIEILWGENEIDVRMPVTLPGAAATMTSGCAKGLTFLSSASEENLPVIEDRTVISVKALIELYSKFQKRSHLFQETGAVHCAALCSEQEIIVFTEDIGRHNAVDKIIGYAFLENIPMQAKILLLTGRLSSEITVKAIKAGVPVLVSRAAPTDMSVEIAKRTGITLIGFLRGHHMNVYSRADRLKG